MILNMKRGKAQVSVEYLVIIGLSFAVLIPTSYFFYQYSQKSSEGVVRQQITQIGNEVLKNAETIYGLSDGTLTTVTLKYPSNIRDMYILSNNELIIRYEISSGINDAVFYSKVPLSGPVDLTGTACAAPCGNSRLNATAPNQGEHSIKMESKTSYVLVTQVSGG